MARETLKDLIAFLAVARVTARNPEDSAIKAVGMVGGSLRRCSRLYQLEACAAACR
jgi:hypothetical protein